MGSHSCHFGCIGRITDIRSSRSGTFHQDPRQLYVRRRQNRAGHLLLQIIQQEEVPRIPAVHTPVGMVAVIMEVVVTVLVATAEAEPTCYKCTRAIAST